ncbi:MAG: AEC family transporter [Christensenellales bacterium]|nr:AEC family transporter [Christensenellales bacterium]
MITEILSKVLPVLVMIALGRLCETKQIINDEQHAGLKAIVGDILLPVVLFQAFFTADYGKRMLLVFVLVFVGYGAALAAGYALRRFVKPYDRFMPLLMTSAEGGMLGYALYALLCGADQTKTYAMVDIGQTVFAYTVFLTALKAAGGEKMTPKFIMKNIVTNKGCIGMLSGIVLGALGVYRAIDGTAAGEIVSSLLSFITAPTSALILIIMGYQLHVSRQLLRPVLTTMGLRLGVLAVVCAAVSGILFAVIPFDKGLLLALMLQYSLPAPFIIPLFADLGDDAEYVSTTLSLGTVLAVLLFFLLAAFSLA